MSIGSSDLILFQLLVDRMTLPRGHVPMQKKCRRLLLCCLLRHVMMYYDDVHNIYQDVSSVMGG